MITSMKSIKMLYVEDNDFPNPRHSYTSSATLVDYIIQQGYLFKGNQMYISNTSLHIHVIRKMHIRGLIAHVAKDNTLAQLQAQFFVAILEVMLADI